MTSTLSLHSRLAMNYDSISRCTLNKISSLIIITFRRLDLELRRYTTNIKKVVLSRTTRGLINTDLDVISRSSGISKLAPKLIRLSKTGTNQILLNISFLRQAKIYCKMILKGPIFVWFVVKMTQFMANFSILEAAIKRSLEIQWFSLSGCVCINTPVVTPVIHRLTTQGPLLRSVCRMDYLNNSFNVFLVQFLLKALHSSFLWSRNFWHSRGLRIYDKWLHGSPAYRDGR